MSKYNIDPTKKPVEYKSEMMIARQRYAYGEVEYSAVVEKAEQYIESVNQWCKRNGKKAPKLSVTGLLR